uniref:proteasome endopeptidase complex n=1 Tax=Sinocyclocheilus grahami TaxID=75366 RepID=A0A672RHD5_SINGR
MGIRHLSKHSYIRSLSIISSFHAQAVTKMAKFQLSFHSIQMESPPLVKAAASIMRELCYSNKEELQAGFITAGWDRKKGPQVILSPFGGSGNTYIYGYVDAKFKPDMSLEEATQFSTNALALAMGRDNVSGSVVHLVVITEAEVKHIVVPGDKLPKLFYSPPL